MLATSLYYFVFSVTLAAIEIEAEGKYGWAEKMPTWYRTTGFTAKIYGMLMGGKPLTGYHMWMFVFPLIIFHMPFFNGVEWTIDGELRTFANYFAVAVLWDYLWFILNPAYGFQNFRKENVWWHAKSVWILNRIPIDYMFGWSVSVALCAVIAWRTGDTVVLEEHLGMLILMTWLTWFTICFSPIYHRWRSNMLDEERDDRKNVDIVHNLLDQ